MKNGSRINNFPHKNMITISPHKSFGFKIRTKKNGFAFPVALHPKAVDALTFQHGGTKPPYEDNRHKKCLS